MDESNLVKLRIYDLSGGLAKQFGEQLGLDIDGIWHTSVEVFGKEYYFDKRVVYANPGETHYSNLKEILTIGKTNLTVDILHEYIDSLGHKYNDGHYDLMTNNCNHFSNDITLFLCSKSIPDYILLLPEMVMNSPMYSALVQKFISGDKQDKSTG